MKAEAELKAALEAYIGHEHEQGVCIVSQCVLAQAMLEAADTADLEKRQARLNWLREKMVESLTNPLYANLFGVEVTENFVALMRERTANIMMWLPDELKGEGE